MPQLCLGWQGAVLWLRKPSTRTAKRGVSRSYLPLDPPASWDREVDLVVVGTGGGGLAATTLAAESGSSVIAVEKEGTVGGARVMRWAM